MEKTTTTRKTSPKTEAKVEDKPVSKPVESELKTSEADSKTPAPAAAPEKVQTDVREKLARKSDKEDAFVPTTPAKLEGEAKDLAQNMGFEFNRGTSVGARLMARARQQFPQ